MYAHVNTYRLGSSEEVAAEITWAEESGDIISDQSARTIASWYHSPAAGSRNITALSHGLPFYTDALREEIEREIVPAADGEGQQGDATALTAWLDALEANLAGASA